ncbi:hypothetical protein L2E82_02051 [Cichorium intybus]|uniref:Uncharacterized protein n=1 Tax=Cichorium intybus TaxID=13427 RepID=A0ACB9H0P1_CICIN|nr:hypothetical protein L2E82_02051 [Cichorium intybus]
MHGFWCQSREGRIATAANPYREDQGEDPFVVLSEWTSYLFVNPSDPICAEYIGYFEHREKMEEIGVGRIKRIATRHSIGSLVSGTMGRDSEPLHLLPMAYMTVNSSPRRILIKLMELNNGGKIIFNGNR